MKNIDKYYQFLEAICDNLEMEVPTIEFDESNFTTKTQIASCHVKDKIIFLNKKCKHEKPTFDTYFALAHETRHIWQFMFDEWQNIIASHANNTHLSIQEYNMQAEEIDANAYGAVVMMNMTGYKPLFNGLNKEIIAMIEERIAEFNRCSKN